MPSKPNTPEFHYGRISGWRCGSCNIYNDILRVECAYKCGRERDTELDWHAHWAQHTRLGDIHKIMKMSEQEQKEMHIHFFNQACAKSAEYSTFAELDEWIETLEVMAAQAKAVAQGALHGKRERVAKLSKEEREKLVSNPDITGSDAFGAVKQRATRMTQADKLVKTYRDLGMSEEEIKTLVGNIKTSEDKPRLEPLIDKPVRTEIEPEDRIIKTKKNIFPFKKQDDTVKEIIPEPVSPALESFSKTVNETVAEVKIEETKPVIEEDEPFSFMKGLFKK